jgi:branched-chain amino acid transport system substrate-binding protein
MRTLQYAVAAAVGIAALTGAARAADCDVTIGVVMELTGPAGAYGQAGAKSIEMAFRDINDAGGVNGCRLLTDTRDAQSQGNVAVDVATQLVQVKKVPAIIGGIISSVSLPILTSVTAPANVVQISPASSSPTLTQLGREGKTNGVFFRTITSDALQGTAAAKFALDQGLRKLSVIHVNNDFGVNMVAEFRRPMWRSAAPSSRIRPTTRSSRPIRLRSLPRWRASQMASTSSATRSTARRLRAAGSAKVARRNFC